MYLNPLSLWERVRVLLLCICCTRSRAGFKTYLRVPPRPLSRIPVLRGTRTSLCIAGGVLYFACAKKVPKESTSPSLAGRKPRPVPCAPRPTGAPLLVAPLSMALLRQCSRTSPGGAAVLGELKGDWKISIYPVTLLRCQRHDGFRKVLIKFFGTP